MTTELSTATIPATDVALCDACGHPTDGHDVISARYCAATVAGAISRTCICPGR